MLTVLTIIKAFILPPGLVMVLLILGLCCWRWRKLSFAILVLATLLLYLLSLAPVGLWLAYPLQHAYPALTEKALVKARAQAIVVLSSGRYKTPPEYAGVDRASQNEIMRLQYAAYLYRKTHLPILVSGGFCFEHDVSEAEIMARVLRDDFHVPVRWIESQSENTWQNAYYSVKILREHHLQRAFIVTDAIHIPRSIRSFKHFGFEPIAAPTHFFTSEDERAWWLLLLPNPEALERNIGVLYEYFGLVLYQTKG